MQTATAIILAAGRGTRLRSVTGDEFPKPLVPLKNKPVIEYSIEALRSAGTDRILIGCGYMIEAFGYLENKYKEVRIVENELYDIHASIYTLLMFSEWVKEPFLLLESDILYDPAIIKKLISDRKGENVILTSTPLELDDNVYFTSENDMLISLSKGLKSTEPEGVMTGIWSFKAGLLQRFNDYCNRMDIDLNEDYEVLLARYSAEEEPIRIYHLPDLNWCEIDNEVHLEYALEEVLPKIGNTEPNSLGQ